MGYCLNYNTKFLGLANKEMYGHQLGELVFRSWVKGLKLMSHDLTDKVGRGA